MDDATPTGATPPPPGGGDASDGDAPTTVTPGGASEERTSVSPPAATPQTTVAPDAAVTRVQARGNEAAAPGAGVTAPTGGPPPPAASHRARRPGGGAPWWVYVLLAAVAAASVGVMVWLLVLRDDGSAYAVYRGTWMPVTAGQGPIGGLEIDDDSPPQVQVYSQDLAEFGPYASDASGGQLVVEIIGAGTLLGGSGNATLTLTHETATDRLLVAIGGAGTDVQVIQMQRTDQLMPATPLPTVPPTATPTASPSVTPTGTGSPSPGTSPSADPAQAVRDGVIAIQVGVLTWASQHGGAFPLAAQVQQQGEVAQYVDPWPVNPYTQVPMKQGSTPGDYTYELLDAGGGYQLTGYLDDGSTFVLP